MRELGERPDRHPRQEREQQGEVDRLRPVPDRLHAASRASVPDGHGRGFAAAAPGRSAWHCASTVSDWHESAQFAPSRQVSCGSSSRSSTTGSASTAGPRSPGCGRSRASSAPRSTRSSRAGPTLAVAGRTDTGSTRTGQVVSRRRRRRAAARARPRRRSTPSCRTTSRSTRPTRRRPTSTRATPRGRAATATASGAAGARHRSSSAAAGGSRGRSTRRSSPTSPTLLLGEHDFRAFTPTETQHRVFVRNVHSAAWHRRGDVLELEITADSFLRHMVRTLVGTMLERTPEELAALLERRLARRGGHDGAAVGPLPRAGGLLADETGQFARCVPPSPSTSAWNTTSLPRSALCQRWVLVRRPSKGNQPSVSISSPSRNTRIFAVPPAG